MFQVRTVLRNVCAAFVGGAVLAMCATPAWSACKAPAADGRAAHPFEVDGGLAFERAKGLLWQRCSVGQHFDDGACIGTVQKMDWDSAEKAAAAAGGGWRLPTSAELSSLVLFYCEAPATDTSVFPATPGAWYWSASTDGAKGAWFVDFEQGGGGGATLRTSTAAVRLVRTGGH